MKKVSIILMIILLLMQSASVYAARLPTVGGDSDDWGDILNAYLSVSLDSDGTLKENQNGNLTVNGTFKVIEPDGDIFINIDPVNENIALGHGAVATGARAIAIGPYNADAPGVGAVALGNVANASGAWSTAIGPNSRSRGPYAIAIGYETTADGNNSFASGRDTDASGESSTAMGYISEAEGNYSFAVGDWAVAHGTASVAMGEQANAEQDYTIAIGDNPSAEAIGAIAIGTHTIAEENYATAIGYYTRASEQYATALGRSTRAFGDTSTAMGYNTTASGDYSTAMGYNTIASGDYSTTTGRGTTASGAVATAIGYNTVANQMGAFAAGYSTTASGSYATAMGDRTNSSGYASTTFGRYTNANSYISFALGSFNIGGGDPIEWVSTDPLFEIGIGTADDNRSNALTVLKDGNVGIGTPSPSTLLDVNGTASVEELCIDGDCKTTWPAGVTNGTGEYSTQLGYNTTASGNYSLATGKDTVAQGTYSTALGHTTRAIGGFSTAMGRSTVASGEWSSTAMGAFTNASGGISTAMGYFTNAIGDMSTAIGYFTKAEAFASLAVGGYNVGGGDNENWVGTDPVLEVGIGTADDNRSNALTILKNGNVGIGTSNPGVMLDIDGEDNAARMEITSNSEASMHISSSSINYINVGEGSADTSYINLWGDVAHIMFLKNDLSVDWRIGKLLTDDLSIRDEDSENTRLTIKKDTGNVGINTPTPARTLHINDTLRIEPRASAPSSPSLGDLYVDADLNELCFYNSTAWVGIISGGECS